MLDKKQTAKTRARYQRISSFYDLMEVFAERRYTDWREKLWGQVTGARVLEIGVGTGKNIPFYPDGPEITAVDLTPGMLARAKRRADRLGARVNLSLDDAQDLKFEDDSFDIVVATFVFCSVPDPVLGFKEARRVLKPGGKLLLLEHVRSENQLLGGLMDLFNPLVVRMMGANINRDTVDNLQQSGFDLEQVEDMGLGGIFKLIVGV